MSVAPTLVQAPPVTTTTSNIGSVTCNFPGAQTEYDTNLVFVKVAIAGDITSVKDTNSNGVPATGYPLVGSWTNGLFNIYCYAAYLIKAAVAGANTVTVALSTTGLSVTVAIVEASQCFVDSFGGSAPNTQNIAVGGVLTSQAVNALLVSFSAGNAAGTPTVTAGQGWTSLQAGNGSAADAYILQDKTVSANGNQNLYATGVGAAAATASTIFAVALSTQQFLTSGTSYTPLGTGTYTVEIIAPGGAGSTMSSGQAGGGGGGGAYAKIIGLSLTAGSAVTYQVGLASTSTDSWFNGGSLAASSVGAKAGTAGMGNTGVGGSGGVASSGINSLYSGGAGGSGGSTNIGGNGGGGAGAPSGNGKSGATTNTAVKASGGGGAGGNLATAGVDGGSTGNGGTAQDGTAGGVGGGANAGSHGSGGGGGNNSNGGAGGNGIEWDSAHGAGGGGGGSSNPGSGGTTGGAGGLYGGGGGGGGSTIASNNIGGAGGASLIVLTFVPPAAPTGNAIFFGMNM